jgi:hypothetical protein
MHAAVAQAAMPRHGTKDSIPERVYGVLTAAGRGGKKMGSEEKTAERSVSLQRQWAAEVGIDPPHAAVSGDAQVARGVVGGSDEIHVARSNAARALGAHLQDELTYWKKVAVEESRAARGYQSMPGQVSSHTRATAVTRVKAVAPSAGGKNVMQTGVEEGGSRGGVKAVAPHAAGAAEAKQDLKRQDLKIRLPRGMSSVHPDGHAPLMGGVGVGGAAKDTAVGDPHFHASAAAKVLEAYLGKHGNTVGQPRA